MAKLRLATAALSKNIYAGYPNKAGDGLREPRHNVTSDALKAVIEHIGDNRAAVVNIDGTPAYEIIVRALGTASVAHGNHDVQAPAVEAKEA